MKRRTTIGVRSTLRMTAMALSVVAGIAASADANQGFNGDVTLSGPGAWRELTPSGTLPEVRELSEPVYDPVRQRMIIIGGYHSVELGGAGCLDDVWALQLGPTPAWTQIQPAGASPGPRAALVAVYDPIADRVIVFGGHSDVYAHVVHNDTWSLSLGATPTWTPLNTGGTPPPARNVASAVYDPLRHRMIVFAGGGGPGVYFNDAWSLSLNTLAWTELNPTGPLPSLRYAHSALYDPVKDGMIVCGGVDATGVAMSDTWIMSLGPSPSWKKLDAGPAPALYDHSAVMDPVGRRMIVFAGSSGEPYPHAVNDTWILSLRNPPSWHQYFPSGSLPSARANHSAIYDPVGDQMLAFGGQYPDLNDVWSLTWAPGGVREQEVARSARSHDAAARGADPAGDASGFALLSAWPNPAAGPVSIRFRLPVASDVEIQVYDPAGRAVTAPIRSHCVAGSQELSWPGTTGAGQRLAPGVYFLKLVAGAHTASSRILVVR